MIQELTNLLSYRAWLFESNFAERIVPVMFNQLMNGKLSLPSYKDEAKRKFSARFNGTESTIIGQHVYSTRKVKHKSGKYVAVIPVIGSLTKRGELCSYGMRDYMNEIAALNNNEDISAIVLDMEGPGGTVDGTNEFGLTIRGSKKPIVTFGDYMVASANYWAASQSRWIVGNKNNPTEFGSIGVLCVHEYWGKFIEENIGEVRIIRAPQSVDKARVNFIEQLTPELEQEIIFDLKNCAKDFFSAVKKGRGDRLKGSEKEWGTGKMFKVAEALDLGLIDSAGDIMSAIDKAVELASGTTSTTKKSHTKNSNMNVKQVARKVSSFFTSKKAATKAAKEKPAAAEEDDTTPMWTEDMIFNTDGSGDGAFCLHADSEGNDRKFETKIDNNQGKEPPTDPAITEDDNWSVVVEEAAEEEEEASATAETSVTKLNAALKKSKGEVKTLTARVAQLEKDKKDLNTKLEKKPAGAATTVTSKSDKGHEYAGKKAVQSWEKKAVQKVGSKTEE